MICLRPRIQRVAGRQEPHFASDRKGRNATTAPGIGRPPCDERFLRGGALPAINATRIGRIEGSSLPTFELELGGSFQADIDQSPPGAADSFEAAGAEKIGVRLNRQPLGVDAPPRADRVRGTSTITGAIVL